MPGTQNLNVEPSSFKLSSRISLLLLWTTTKSSLVTFIDSRKYSQANIVISGLGFSGLGCEFWFHGLDAALKGRTWHSPWCWWILRWWHRAARTPPRAKNKDGMYWGHEPMDGGCHNKFEELRMFMWRWIYQLYEILARESFICMSILINPKFQGISKNI